MNLWIAERAILTPKNSSVDQINVFISQELSHGEAKFYPVLTVHVILEIPPDFPRNSEQAHSCWTPSISPQQKEDMVLMLLRSLSPKNFTIVQGTSLVNPPASFSTARSP